MKGEEISKEKSLTIVIPALNEEKKIALTVEKILSKARENLEKFEIIIQIIQIIIKFEILNSLEI